MQHDRTITVNINISSRWVRRLLVFAAVAGLVVPTAAWAGHQFDDVPDSNIFHDDIAWMRDNGVTVGCNPPANDEYCPSDNVTREQMAAFMRRLESKGVFLPADGKAVDADKLDGLDASHFMPRFAVVKDATSATAELLASRGVVDWSHTEGTGIYLFEFDADISDCAWSVTPGARNNGTWADGFGRTANAHSVSTGPTFVRVEGKDQNFDDEETSFNLVINC